MNRPLDAIRFAARTAALACAALAVVGAGASLRTSAHAVPRFATHEIATGLRGGYQVIAADLNRDGKPDLIAVASNLPELVWFENPGWTRHVIAGGFTGLINVAAADLDGDGIPEIAVASGFSTQPDKSAGIVALLTHGADPTKPWTTREIDRVPSAHRLRWYVDRNNQRWLLVSPLAADTAHAPSYDGPTPIYAYRAPDWKREVVPSAERGVVHAVEPFQSPFCYDCFLTAGFAGIHRYSHGDRWFVDKISDGNTQPPPAGGSSDLAFGHPPPFGQAPFLAAIEPWHGNQLVVYWSGGLERVQRQVVDTTLVDAHTIVTADLDGDGIDEVIVGQRGGTRSLHVYSLDRRGPVWSRTRVDSGGMAAAGCTAVDVNGDSRVDIACIGTATANLKWYENLGGSPR